MLLREYYGSSMLHSIFQSVSQAMDKLLARILEKRKQHVSDRQYWVVSTQLPSSSLAVFPGLIKVPLFRFDLQPRLSHPLAPAQHVYRQS